MPNTCSRSVHLLGQGGGADIHLHERGPSGAKTIREICARTEADGLQGKVAISHAFVLGDDGMIDAVSCVWSNPASILDGVASYTP